MADNDLGAQISSFDLSGIPKISDEDFAHYSAQPLVARQFSEDNYIRDRLIEMSMRKPLRYSIEEYHEFFSKAIPETLARFESIYRHKYTGKHLTELLLLEETTAELHKETLKELSKF